MKCGRIGGKERDWLEVHVVGLACIVVVLAGFVVGVLVLIFRARGER